MTTSSQEPAPAGIDPLGKAAAHPPAAALAEPAARSPRLLRAWHAVRSAWLVRRLTRLELELHALTARLATPVRDGMPLSRQDMQSLERCHMERALLRARLQRSRSLG